MTIELLDISVMRAIYDDAMKRDFPPAELKPFSSIERMYMNGVYFGYGAFDDENRLLAYAFFVKANECEWILLDYYAVTAESRGNGIGTRFLGLLRDELSYFDGMTIECEDPQRPSATTSRETMERRIAFYLRCGAEQTMIRSSLFGVDYTILCLPLRSRAQSSDVYSGLRKVYRTMFSPDKLKKYVRLFKIRDAEAGERL